MKKNMIALLLIIVMAAGSIGGASAFAAETIDETAAEAVIAESAVVETDDGQVDAQEYDTDLTEEGSDTQSPEADPAAEDPGVQEDPEEGLDIAVPEQAEDADEQEISEVTAEKEGSEAISEETEAANEGATEGATEEYTAPEEELIQTDETIMAEESNEALKENAPAVGGAQAIWTADNATLTFLDSSDAYYPGETYNEATITNVWYGTDVTDSGTRNPAWLKTIENSVTTVIFDDTFIVNKPSSMANWFNGCSNLVSVNTKGLDTSNVTTMYYLFGGCNNLENVDVSHFDTSNVTDMRFMFTGCEKLEGLDVKRFDTSKVRLMYGMFSGCSTLTVLDLSAFDVTKVEDMNRMFDYCYNLTTIYCKDENTDWSDKCKELTMFWFCTPLVGRFDDKAIKYSSNSIKGNMAKAASLGGYFTPKVNYFRIGRDSNSFRHGTMVIDDPEPNKVGDAYRTSPFYLSKLLKISSKSEIEHILDIMYHKDGWGGSCRGLCTSLGLAYLKKLDISNFNSTTGSTPKCYNDLAAPPDNIGLRDLINYYQLLQYVEKFSPKKKLIKQDLGKWLHNESLSQIWFWQGFINEVKDANNKLTPILFNMGYQESDGNHKGHTLLTCGYNETEQYYIIQLYDLNKSSPASEEHNDYLYFFIDKSSYWFCLSTTDAKIIETTLYTSYARWEDFSYFGAEFWDKFSTETEPEDSSENMYFTVVAGKPFRIENNKQEFLELINDKLQGDLPVYDLDVLGDSSEYQFKLAKDDNYIITDFDNETKFCIRTDENYISVAAEGADKIIVNEGNKISLEGNNVSYDVRLSMNTRTALMELSGTASSKADIEHENNNITIESDDPGDVDITIYDTQGNVSSNTVEGGSTITIDENDYVSYTSVETCDVSLSKDRVTYSGTEQRPSVVVKNGSYTLEEQKDYEVRYENNISVGTATVTITGIGSYSGTVTKTFTILPGKTTRGDMFNLANNVKVTWKEVPGAKYYKVYREGVTDKKETRKDPVIVTTGLVGWDKDPGLTNGHAYRYRIVASLTGKGDSGGDSPLSYSKLMYRLKTVVIRSVKNTAPGAVTVKYDKTTSGDSYVLQYSDNKDMKNAKTKVVLGAGNTSYVLKGLKKGKTYYISIRVRKKVDGIDYYTTFGVPKKITITK